MLFLFSLLLLLLSFSYFNGLYPLWFYLESRCGTLIGSCESIGMLLRRPEVPEIVFWYLLTSTIDTTRIWVLFKRKAHITSQLVCNK